MSDEPRNEDRKASEPRALEETMRTLGDTIAERERAMEAHRATCTLPICALCDRHACPRCRERSGAPDTLCARCELDDALRPARRVPKRFAWTHAAERDELVKVVNASGGNLSGDTIDRALAFARRRETSSLTLIGDSGVGKSTLLAAMYAAWVAVHRAPSARFFDAMGLARARTAHPFGKGEAAPDVAAAMRAALLGLDGIGDILRGDEEVVTEIMSARYDEQLPTWATTGQSRADLARRYGSNVARRIFDEALVIKVGEYASAAGGKR